MIRGTTPTHKWTIPVDASFIRGIRVIYKQGEDVLLVKTTEDCIVEGKKLKVTLTQEDTLKFSHEDTAEVQVRLLTTDMKSLATRVMKVPIWELLDDEVML